MIHPTTTSEAEPTSTPRPISARRLAANRANAQLSTGPRTAQGKLNSSLNAQKTGIHGSLHAVRSGVFREDPLEVEALLDDVLAALGPRDHLEHRLAVQVATLLQRMKRTDRVEAIHFSAIGRLEHDTLDAEEIYDAEFNSQLYRTAAALLERDPASYTPDEINSLALAQARFDSCVADTFAQLDPGDEDDAAADLLGGVLESLTATHGDRVSAQQTFTEVAASEASKVPDPAEEQLVAEKAVRVAIKDGTIESTSRILARLSLDLDRQLDRYWTVRSRPMAADHERTEPAPATSHEGPDLDPKNEPTD